MHCTDAPMSRPICTVQTRLVHFSMCTVQVLCWGPMPQCALYRCPNAPPNVHCTDGVSTLFNVHCTGAMLGSYAPMCTVQMPQSPPNVHCTGPYHLTLPLQGNPPVYPGAYMPHPPVSDQTGADRSQRHAIYFLSVLKKIRAKNHLLHI